MAGTSKEQQRRMRDYRARQEVHARRSRRTRRDSIIGGALAAIVLLGGAGAVALQQGGAADPAATDLSATDPAPTLPVDTVPPEGENSPDVPDPSLAEGRTWEGTLTINGVPLAVELDGAAAPQSVAAVLADAQSGYYDGKTCHRMTTNPGFQVLQCGSVDGSGMGDPAWRFGPIENAPADDQYPQGTIALARAGGDAYSNGHQFFLVYGDTTIPSDAAGGYSVIGRVTDGLDALQEAVISAGTATDAPNPADAAPAIPVTIDGFVLE